MQATATASDPSALRVYWAPGCSSCVKVKEHLAALGVPYVSVDVAAEPGARAELAARGIRSIPVLTRGDRHVFAQSLEDVSAFVGKDYVPPARQQVAFLFDRWQALLDQAVGYLDACPPAHLLQDVIKERKRSIGELGFHVFQIADAFLHSVRTGDLDWFVRASGPADLAVSHDKAKLMAYASRVADELRAWRAANGQGFGEARRSYEGGLKSDYEFLDRSSWHSAQHVRQLATVLERDGVPITPRWDEAMVEGLGVPQKLWT